MEVGPYSVIDAHVEIGAGTRVSTHVYLTGHTVIGAGNRIFAGCIIGEAPQDLKYRDEPTRLVIGDNNVFREHTTVHRSTKVEEPTVLGSNNFLMQHSHVAHNCHVGNQTIIAGGALLAGHVVVQDRAFVSGNCLVHQFVRIGTLAMMQGGSSISKDLPPFTIATGANAICGLNVVGLRRAGYSAADRLELKQLYRALFRSNLGVRAALAAAKGQYATAAARELIEFVEQSRRGVVTHPRGRAEEE